ncbi:unnamed protein product [Oikopleura dioica]|uniref:Uncharacterized protein n=1 Tax=Oikopleura dioica TaxID=34765 RepID=E4YYY6_OIKDI|nr:unnamed protein product [Oikopleura dioica]
MLSSTTSRALSVTVRRPLTVSTASSLKNTPKKLMIQKVGQRDHFGNAKQFEAQLNTTAGSKKFPFFRNKVVA